LRATPAHALLFTLLLSTVSVLTQVTFAAGSNALTVVFVRNAVGALAIAAWLAATHAPMRLSRRDYLVASAIGVVLALNNLSLNMAIERVPVPVAILAFYTFPVWMAVWAWLRGHETFSLKSAVGVVLAFVGIALTLGVAPVLPNPVGVGLALLSALLWSSVMVLSGHFLAGANTHARSLHMLVAAAVTVLILLLAFGTPKLPEGAVGLGALAFLAVAFGLAMLGVLWVTAKLGPMRASFWMNIEPIAAIALSALFLGQVLTAMQLLGAGLVLVSLVIFRPPARA
jgi:drug/metabolite transporter (DMT)-like permease